MYDDDLRRRMIINVNDDYFEMCELYAEDDNENNNETFSYEDYGFMG